MSYIKEFSTSIYKIDFMKNNEIDQLKNELVNLKIQEKLHYINKDELLDDYYNHDILNTNEWIEQSMYIKEQYNKKIEFINNLLILLGSDPGTDTDSNSGNNTEIIPDSEDEYE